MDVQRKRARFARPVNLARGDRGRWYRIEAHSAPAATDVYIYDEIGYFGVTASDFVRDVTAIKSATINLHINTPGGDVFDGVTIYNALRDHAATVNVVIDGLAASAGSFIAQAGDTVTMNRASTMMIHDASGLAMGNAADMRKLADLLDQTSGTIAGIYQARAGGELADWRAAMLAETWYTASEAVAAGLADAVREDGNSGAPANEWDLSIFNFAGREYAPAPVSARPEIDPDEFRRALREAFV